MRTQSLFRKLALICCLSLPGGLANACLSFECQATDTVCRPEMLLLYLLQNPAVDPGCNFTQSLNFDALQQEAYIKTSNPDANDGANGAIAFDCETQTLALGLLSEASNATGINGDQTDNSAADTGAVYVFRFQNGQWSQEAYLKASNAEAQDQFGVSVAISGNTLVAGALFEDSAATGVNGSQADNSSLNSGAAYVFRRDSSGAWFQEAYLKASNTGNDDEFGRRVAISGDLIAVSARVEDSSAAGINGNQADNSANNSGAAYVFRRTDNTWQQEAYIKSSTPEGNDRFGTSIALDGETLAVGALGEDSSATGVGPDGGDNLSPGAGAAYVFTAVNGIWSQQAYVKASNTDDCDSFGSAVALRGDLLAVTSQEEASNASGINGDQTNNGALQAGAVYVYRRSELTWSQEAYIKASNSQGGDAFGTSVAVGNESLVVGAVTEDSNATGINGDGTNNGASIAGAAYLFRRSGGIWSEAAYIKASNSEANDRMGFGVTVSGNGMAVYAPEEDGPSTGINGSQANGANGTGAVYFFR